MTKASRVASLLAVVICLVGVAANAVAEGMEAETVVARDATEFRSEAMVGLRLVRCG